MSSVFPGVVIIVIFLVLAGLMVARKIPALLALPIMAVLIALTSGLYAGLPLSATGAGPSLRTLIFDTVLEKGAGSLINPMLYAIFGSILSQVVMRLGIAQRIVRVAAEFAGDKKMLLAIVMTGAVAVAFTSLTGFGAVILIGSLVLPILVGAGMSATYAGGLLLFGISLGGMFNGANLGFYKDVLGLPLDLVTGYARVFGALLGAITIAFIAVNSFLERRSFSWASQEPIEVARVPLLALFTPIIPVVLIMTPHVHWPIIPAFIVGILYGCITTQPMRLIPNLTAATLEGLKEIGPVIGLFMGIGMTKNAVVDPITSKIMAPFMSAITPTHVAGYVLFFFLLAPLTLYRGPLNLYGLGAGFAGLLLTTHLLTPIAIMAAFMATGQMQGVCDPTNTHNVWIAQFTHTSTDDLLKKTILFVWAFVLCALIYTVTLGHGF
jgi:hypothetical protein